MSTPVGDLIISRKVYRGCVIYIYDRDTLVDFIKLEMLDFLCYLEDGLAPFVLFSS